MARTSEVSVILSNLQVLDCKVCNLPLTIPVLQCKKGHTACNTCCVRLGSKCGTCDLEMDIKCPHLDEIIQSHMFHCQNNCYGCEELTSYCNKKDHEENCAYECYPCPQPACPFRGLSKQLSDHFFSVHERNLTKTFRYYQDFDLELCKNQRICVLKEAESGDVFVLNNETAKCGGNKISISFVTLARPASGKVVEVKVTSGTCFLKFCGLARSARSISQMSGPQELFNISRDFVGLKDSFSIIMKLRPVVEHVVDERVDVDQLLEFEKEQVEKFQKTCEYLNRMIGIST